MEISWRLLEKEQMKENYCMRKAFIILMMLCFTTIYAQQEFSYMERCFDDIIASKFKKIIASSFLIEKGKPRDYYAPEKAFDNDINTAWVEGVEGDGIGEYIVFPINIEGSRYDQNDPKIDMKITNGYAKNDKLFFMNNRIKKFIFEVYEAPITFISNAETGDYSFQRLNKVIKTFETIINLKDSRVEQIFTFTIKLKHVPAKKEKIYGLIGKIIINDVYPGLKIKDTCISEISVSGTSDY